MLSDKGIIQPLTSPLAVVVEKPKKKDHFGHLPETTWNMEEWKRFYSNNTAEAFNKYLWEKFDNTGFSWWKATYKYNEDNKVCFMTENLIGGMYQVRFCCPQASSK